MRFWLARGATCSAFFVVMVLPRNCAYRGKAGLREEKVPCEPEPTIAKQKTKRGGTAGKGTRGGTQRTASEKLAYDFDADGLQNAALVASLLIYQDSSARSQVCASGGRHACGLVLKRPPTPVCAAQACACAADTPAMAARIGADKLNVSRHSCTSNACTPLKPVCLTACA